MKKIISSSWADIVANKGGIVAHEFSTHSVEQTQNHAESFLSVVEVCSRLHRRFRLGLHGARPGQFSRSALGMSTFAKGLAIRATGDFSSYAEGNHGQIVGYSPKLGLVSIQDNKADHFIPASLSKLFNHVVPTLEIEEHAIYGKRQFHAVIGFWPARGSDKETKRGMAVYASSELANTNSYKRFINQIGASKIELT